MEALARLLVYIFAESYYGYAIVLIIGWYAKDILRFAFDLRVIRKEWPDMVGAVNEISVRVVAIEKRTDSIDKRLDNIDERLARIESAIIVPTRAAAE